MLNPLSVLFHPTLSLKKTRWGWRHEVWMLIRLVLEKPSNLVTTLRWVALASQATAARSPATYKTPACLEEVDLLLAINLAPLGRLLEGVPRHAKHLQGYHRQARKDQQHN